MWREEQVFSTQLSKGGYVPQRWGHTHPTVFTVWVVCWFSYVFFCSYGALFPSRSYSLQLSLFSLGFFLSFRHLLNFCNDFRFTVRCHTWLNSSSCHWCHWFLVLWHAKCSKSCKVVLNLESVSVVRRTAHCLSSYTFPFVLLCSLTLLDFLGRYAYIYLYEKHP